MNTDTLTARILCFLVPFVYLTTIGVVMNCALAGRQPEHFRTLVLANVFAGMMGGGIFLAISLRQWRHQCAKRDHTIAEMNHHVRNALSVLAFYGTKGKDQDTQTAVNAAIQRIRWTLEEVLPEGWSPQAQTRQSRGALHPFQRVNGRTSAEARQR